MIKYTQIGLKSFPLKILVMPLPAALLERLKKRGVVKEDNEEKAEEEVFAENYDNEGDNEEIDSGEKNRSGAPGCPNKWNHYHICSDFCYDYWREGYPERTLPEKYLEQRKRMLRDYPLPPGWKEVYDAGVRRHYYWCPATDEVCWISPRHPKAVISEPAPKLAKEMQERPRPEFQVIKVPDYAKRYDDRDRNRDRRDRGRDDRDRGRESRVRKSRWGRDDDRERSESEAEESDKSDSEKNIEMEISDRDRLKRAVRKKIDPMDPAAYSDAPKGNWSTGLNSEDAKTGVDTTASGPLFQQRPYPTPGAILRKNNPNYGKDTD